jgi:hypothetical protein
MFTGGGEVKLAHEVLLVDVTNGQLYRASTVAKAIMEPAVSPDGGEPRLVRVQQEDSKRWFVRGRAMSLLKDLPVDPKAVDPETGEVLTPSHEVRRYEVK